MKRKWRHQPTWKFVKIKQNIGKGELKRKIIKIIIGKSYKLRDLVTVDCWYISGVFLVFNGFLMHGFLIHGFWWTIAPCRRYIDKSPGSSSS